MMLLTWLRRKFQRVRAAESNITEAVERLDRSHRRLERRARLDRLRSRRTTVQLIRLGEEAMTALTQLEEHRR